MHDPFKFLEDCRADWAFWCVNGNVCRNIYELVEAIEAMSEEDFVYHVNEDHQKNDFAKWIGEVLGDSELMKKLWDELDQHRYIGKIRKLN